MVCREIYEAALRLLSESVVDGENADYEERAPYLIAAFCTDVKETDAAWRRAYAEEGQGEWNAVYVSLDDIFPLAERFAPAAAYYLAAMLVLENNEDMSDRLYDRCSDLVSAVREGIPCEISPIINRYL